MPWFPLMPSHWDIMRGKNLYKKENRSVRQQDEVVTCFRDGIVTLRKNKRMTGFTESAQWSGYQGVRRGDLVIHVMDAFAGAIGVSDSDGKSTPVYNVCTAKGDLNNAYYAYALREMARKGFIQSLYRGIRERSSDFRYEVFASQFFPLPPREEQDQIVCFLDWKVSQINKLINAKKRQIALLQEQRKTIINNAIMHKNDNWKEISISNLGNLRKGFGGSRADDSGDGLACIRYGDIYMTGALVLTQPVTRINKTSSSLYSRVYKNEVLFPLSGETKEDIGVAMVNEINEDTWSSGDVAILKTNEMILPRYLAYCVRCPFVAEQRIIMAKGDIIVHLSSGSIRRLRVLVPPINEQILIVKKLDSISQKIQQMTVGIEQEISLLNEYRTRLISDVVTGKMDVRSVEVPECELIENVAVDETTDQENVDDKVATL
jgi:type I restriction enzyme S subunit